MKFTINNENWKKYRLWAVAVRILLMGIPAVLAVILELVFDKLEDVLFWLDRKLPDPRK